MHTRCSARVSMALVLAIAAVGCRDLTPPIDTDIAFFGVDAIRDGSEFSTRPTAVFLRAARVGIPTSVVTLERCEEEPYPADDSFTALYLDAGPDLETSVSGNGATMFRTFLGEAITYELPVGDSVPFVPGDSIEFTFTPPGAATPFSFKGRTSEALTPQPVTIASDAATSVEWDVPPELGSAILYSFRYAIAPSTTLNRQVSCILFDDGSASVTAGMLSDFRDATVREADVLRFRIRAEALGNLLTIISSTITEPVEVVTP